MNISDKILNYINENDIEQKDFAEKVGITKQNFNHKLTGRVKFNEEDLYKIKKGYPDIDLNKLFDMESDESIMSVAEQSDNYGSSVKLQEEKNDWKAILKIAKKYV